MSTTQRREIKFRAWVKADSRMIQPINMEYATGFFTNPDEYHLEQFTGLKDSKGREIYEGDIVRESWQVNNPYGYCPDDWDDRERVILVKYRAPAFTLKHECGDGGQYCVQEFKREVIGNIHENPELLNT